VAIAVGLGVLAIGVGYRLLSRRLSTPNASHGT